MDEIIIESTHNSVVVQWVRLSRGRHPKLLQKLKKLFVLKMSPKSGLFLLLWLQNSFAGSSFFGAAADHLPLFSSLNTSPLVHFSQHLDKQDQTKYQTIDIVSGLLFKSTSCSRNLKSSSLSPSLGLGEPVRGLYNPQWTWGEPNMH